MNLSLKQFKKEDLFEYTLSIKSGRHDSEGLKTLTNFWVILGPVFVYGIIVYGKIRVHTIATQKYTTPQEA